MTKIKSNQKKISNIDSINDSRAIVSCCDSAQFKNKGISMVVLTKIAFI